ncbi:MAG TPA: hypothetical protein VIH89_09025 [Candidatus Sulfotelmatobacter sp.]
MSAGAKMSVSDPDPAMTQVRDSAEAGQEFNPLAHLLHELNQPLTGLQCSLELAAVGPRTAEQYLRAIREGLGLLARMRMLVAALREIADIEQDGRSRREEIRFDALVRGIIDDLRPVAQSRAIRIDLDENSFPHLCVVCRDVATALFRLFESVLSLAASQSVLSVRMNAQIRQAAIIVGWTEENGSAERPMSSPPELGLLVAQAAWHGAGGQWNSEISGTNRTIDLLLPWADIDTNIDNQLPTSASGDRS